MTIGSAPSGVRVHYPNRDYAVNTVNAAVAAHTSAGPRTSLEYVGISDLDGARVWRLGASLRDPRAFVSGYMPARTRMIDADGEPVDVRPFI